MMPVRLTDKINLSLARIAALRVMNSLLSLIQLKGLLQLLLQFRSPL